MPPRLVPYDQRFLEASLVWFQDRELLRLIRGRPVTLEEQWAWFGSLPRPNYLIWGIEMDGVPIGACGLKNVTSSDAEYWGYLGEARWRGQGIGRWMILRCLEHASRHAIGSLYLVVGTDNPTAIRLYERIGFAVERKTDGALVMRRPTGP